MASPDFLRSLRLIDQFRNRPRPVGNLTYANAVPSPGGYAGVRMGGGLRLGAPSAMPGAAQTVPLGPAAAAPVQPIPAVANPSAFAARWNTTGSAPFGATHRSQAQVVTGEDGTQHVRLVGPKPSMFGAIGSALAGALGMPTQSQQRQDYLNAANDYRAGREGLVALNAAARGNARRQRLFNRSYVPTPLDQMAARNPALAFRLAELQQNGALAREGMGLKRLLGMRGYDVQEGGQKMQYDLGVQQGADRRYVADKTTEASKYRADKEMEGGGLAAVLQFGAPLQKQQALARLAPGQGVLAQTPLSQLPAETQKQISEASAGQAIQIARQNGVPESQINQMKKRQDREMRTPNFLEAPGVGWIQGLSGLTKGSSTRGQFARTGEALLTALADIFGAPFASGGTKRPLQRALPRKVRDYRAQGLLQ